MPTPEEKSIPSLVVTPRAWWHVLYSVNDQMAFRVVFGGDRRPPEEVCVVSVDPPEGLGLPPARYITSFDHEPDEEELDRVAPSAADVEWDEK